MPALVSSSDDELPLRPGPGPASESDSDSESSHDESFMAMFNYIRAASNVNEAQLARLDPIMNFIMRTPSQEDRAAMISVFFNELHRGGGGPLGGRPSSSTSSTTTASTTRTRRRHRNRT